MKVPQSWYDNVETMYKTRYGDRATSGVSFNPRAHEEAAASLADAKAADKAAEMAVVYRLRNPATAAGPACTVSALTFAESRLAVDLKRMHTQTYSNAHTHPLTRTR